MSITQPGPATTYQHDHPPIKNVNVQFEGQLTRGQRLADKATAILGSWPFIIIQSFLLFSWLAVNVYLATMSAVHPGFLKAWDPYPFILLNLLLSFQAAYTGPVVMMSQNRQSGKDRITADNDYRINLKAEKEIEVIIKHLAHQEQLITGLIKKLDSLGQYGAQEQPQ